MNRHTQNNLGGLLLQSTAYDYSSILQHWYTSREKCSVLSSEATHFMRKKLLLSLFFTCARWGMVEWIDRRLLML